MGRKGSEKHKDTILSFVRTAATTPLGYNSNLTGFPIGQKQNNF